MSAIKHPVQEVRQFVKKHPTATASVAAHLSNLLDAYSTKRQQQFGMRELNPLIKPFAKSNAVYPVMQVTPSIEDLVTMFTKHGKLANVLRGLDIAGSMEGGMLNLNKEKKKVPPGQTSK